MSVINLLHDVHDVSIIDGKKMTFEEYLIQGDKGLKIKYFKKNDKGAEKIVITGKDNKFLMRKIKDKDIVEEKELSYADMMKELKEKKFEFALKLLKTVKKGLEGGAKRSKKSKSSKKSKKSKSSKKTKK